MTDEFELCECGNSTASSTGNTTVYGSGNATSGNTSYCYCEKTKQPEYMSVDTPFYQPHFARLRNPDNPIYRMNGWVSENGSVMSSLDQWMEIDFGDRVQVTGLSMQGVQTPEGER